MKGRKVIYGLMLVLLGVILYGCSTKTENAAEEGGLGGEQVDKSGQYLTYEYLGDECQISKEDFFILIMDDQTYYEDWDMIKECKSYFMVVLYNGEVYSFVSTFNPETGQSKLSDYIYLGQLASTQTEYLMREMQEIKMANGEKPVRQSEYYYRYKENGQEGLLEEHYFDALPTEGVFQINQDGKCFCVVWRTYESDINYGEYEKYIIRDEAARRIMMWVLDSDYYQKWEECKDNSNFR